MKAERTKHFENHRLEEKKCPIIYHYDVYSEGVRDFPEHWHANPEFLLMTKGEMTVSSGEEVTHVVPGDLYIVNSNLSHIIKSNTPVSYHCLIVDAAFAAAAEMDISAIRFESLVRDDSINALYMRVAEAYESDSPYSGTAVRAAVLALLLALARGYSEQAEQPPHPRVPATAEEGVRLALGYIRAHVEEPITLSELAGATGFSKYHLIRIFSKRVGKTPMQYIGELRCERAKALLATGKYNCKIVAFRLGFASASYFIKYFKQHTGITPGEYLAACEAKRTIGITEEEDGKNV
ncbi:MAG: helix-turn-helix transcriptional regulator [Clostridia bacterium]|nr:helix-turn-helix transcriptional regulator [Clostridia bacterium]